MTSYRVNPGLTEDIAKFGGETVTRCFNCGTCTASCALSGNEAAFPRKTIRQLQMGLTERLKESPEPWLCYYCGNCSDTCPREAQPAELMMATRRWLTSRYDWTGLSRKLYLSERWEIGMLIGVALLVLALFTVPGMFGIDFGLQAARGAALEHVDLSHVAKKDWVHYGDWALAALLTFFLGTNTLRMVYFIRRGDPVRAPLSVWLSCLPTLALHGATQKRWLDCDDKPRSRWLQHLLLVTGYGTMLLLVVVFLPWFQRDTAEFHWTALPGYYATLMLLAMTVAAMRSRMQKKEAMHRFSHPTDWMFLILLFLTSLSGIMLHLFRLMDLPWPTYLMYVVHLMIAVPMLIIEVPFGKWLHLALRPIGMYLAAVREAARKQQAAAGVATRAA